MQIFFSSSPLLLILVVTYESGRYLYALFVCIAFYPLICCTCQPWMLSVAVFISPHLN